MPALRGSWSTFGGRIRGAIESLERLVPWFGAVALVFLLFAPRPAAATPKSNYCFPYFVLADRWDDVTPIPGYAGDDPKLADWRNNGRWDCEPFTDDVGIGFYEPGDPFVDANHNGRYDAEFYDPLLTGFVKDPMPGNLFSPGGDLGRLIRLVPASARADEVEGHYLAPSGICQGDDWSAEKPNGVDVRTVSELLDDRIALAPTATVDPSTWQIVPYSPCGERFLFALFYDPRITSRYSRSIYKPMKGVPCFIEASTGRGTGALRIVNFPVPPQGPGIECGTGTATLPPSFDRIEVSSVPSSSSSRGATPGPATWGQVKAVYR